MNIVTIIVNYQTPLLVLKCIESLNEERRRYPQLKVVVVDNCSGDDSVNILSHEINKGHLCDWVELIPLKLNGGFGWGNNQAIFHVFQRRALPEAFYLLNPDAAIEPGALEALVNCLIEHPNVGAVGSQLLNSDGSFAGSAFRFPTVLREFVRGIGMARIGRILGVAPIVVPVGFRGNVDWVTGASVLLRAKALLECGLFDTGFFLYFEEVELMHRFSRHGWATYHCPESRVIHLAGASTGVIDGKADGKRVPPDYVFHSRRRYFALTGGRLTAVAANLAWLAGDLLRRIAGMKSRVENSDAKNERRALLRIGVRARSHDSVPAFDRFEAEPGGRPAWMVQ